MDKSEDRLVLLAQAGDHHAFDELLKRYERPLFRHLCRMTGQEDAAYDALQETYIAIVRSIRKLRSRSSFKPWAFGVATRVCLKQLARKRGRREHPAAVLDPPDLRPLPDSLASAREELEQLAERVAALSPKLQSVVLLHFFEGLTLKEVAAALEVSLGTVKSRLSAGLAHIRQVRRQPKGVTE
jgi:RNA polymerase sigma-70 factor (ECF subfamily)